MISSLFWTLILIASIWAPIFKRISLPISTAIIFVALVAWTTMAAFPWYLVAIVWLLFLALTIPFNVPLIRNLIVTKIFDIYRSITPKISKTEREALDAGSVWWDGDLFSGDPDWDKLQNFPKPELTNEEKEFLDGPVGKLCEMVDDWEINNNRDLPQDVWDYIKEEKFFGMIVPKEYGGLEFSALAHSEVIMKLASKSMATAVTVMVPNSLGPAELLLNYGTEEQKGKYLPGLANGSEVPCFALTAPEAGSDAASMPDKGIVVKKEIDGKEEILIKLAFSKRYITLAPVATLVGLAFKLYDPENLIGDEEDIGITVALIPADTPGVELGERHDPLGVAFMNGPVEGKDVYIPLDYVVGGKERVGQGWRMLMERLAIGRSISLPALSVAATKRAARSTGAYARVRKQFKLPIGKFEGVEEKLAEIAGNAYLTDAARRMTVGAVDLGEHPAVVSALAKYNTTERMRSTINAAMDVQAGSGISMGPRNYLAGAYMAAPIGVTVEGANILTRSLIVFGQGALRCHPYVLKEMEAAQIEDRSEAIRRFDETLFGHIGFSMSNGARALFHGLTGSGLATAPSGQTQRHYQRLTRMSAAFALTADVAMLTLGAALKKKERISARMADALSHLYLASSALKKFEDDNRPATDKDLLRWSVETSMKGVQDSLGGVIDNLPVRPAAWLLEVLIFPLGRREKGASDRLSHKVASIIMAPSDARDRLTEGIFNTADPTEALGRVEDAFMKVIAAEPVERKLKEATKSGAIEKSDNVTMATKAAKANLISDDELKIIIDAENARSDVITVDNFPPEHFNIAPEKSDSAREDSMAVA